LSSSRPRSRSSALVALAVFGSTLAVCAASLAGHRQLGYMRGLADRWLVLGLNLAAYGVLGDRTEPTLFKPPGYPALVRAVLWPLGFPPPAETPSRFGSASELEGLDVLYQPAYLEKAARAVYWSNAVLLAGAAALLFLWLCAHVRTSVAVAAALVFGVNPYSVILAGILYYAVAHLFAIVAGTYLLDRALRVWPVRPWVLLAAGVAWGLATLIRPMTLILPAFVFAALVWKTGRAWKRSLAGAAVFTAGMALAIAPWTARNYRVSGHVVPVNAQSWMAVWPATARLVDVQPNHYRWKAMRDRWMILLKRIPTDRLRTDPNSIDDNLTLEAELRDIALRNLRRRPAVYARNMLRSFVTFNLHINSVLVKVYQRLQQPAPLKDWYWPGDPQDFHPPHASRAFAGLVALLTALGAAGVVLGVREKDPALLAPGAVYLCLLVAHSITWVDLMYYYVKLPLLVAFAFVFVDRAHRWRIARAGASGISLGAVLNVLLVLYALGLCAWVLG
jgi:hypothetical protein